MVTSGTLSAACLGVERKQRKRSESTRLVGGVRCGVASGVLLSSHRSPPSYLASRLSQKDPTFLAPFYHLAALIDKIEEDWKTWFVSKRTDHGVPDTVFAWWSRYEILARYHPDLF
jgi:hypothetical protein